MKSASARLWLIWSSLILVGAEFAFFVLAPVLGYPLEFAQSIRLMEILIPVFVGYLGSAAYSLFRSSGNGAVKFEQSQEATLLVRGPIIVFAFASITALTAFGISNGANRPSGSGMSVDTLAGIFTAILGLLSATTGVIVSHLFAVEQHAGEGTRPD